MTHPHTFMFVRIEDTDPPGRVVHVRCDCGAAQELLTEKADLEVFTDIVAFNSQAEDERRQELSI